MEIIEQVICHYEALLASAEANCR